MLLILVKAGYDPNTRDDEGKLPKDYAERGDLSPQWEWALRGLGKRWSMGGGQGSYVVLINHSVLIYAGLIIWG